MEYGVGGTRSKSTRSSEPPPGAGKPACPPSTSPQASWRMSSYAAACWTGSSTTKDTKRTKEAKKRQAVRHSPFRTSGIPVQQGRTGRASPHTTGAGGSLGRLSLLRDDPLAAAGLDFAASGLFLTDRPYEPYRPSPSPPPLLPGPPTAFFASD